ncbi:DNA-directed RNA polymerase subunit beta [Nocardia sp. NBC_00508]|uniref:DNA-directed RNA polymerase subunit beta n=1 Tax=Nocardia sp. NBC_00508 TaxID=2975992 RepID=UPI002E8244AB|nr:DNA-directed RNA polymerase subunit beta [Nocardia sp. NBC_00508]WUD64100.1 DNA-directed RNA polymerase subunit beta [Nocardia sp. NBC_00508]
MDDSAFADTPTSRCAYYRRTCGIPAAIHPENGHIVVRSGMIGGITMPARLGQQVRDNLLHNRFALGPVIAHVRSGRWTYLIRPDLPDDIRLFAELFRLDVSVVPIGGDIALPSPADAHAVYRQWVVAPRDSFRPSGLLIVETIRACVARKAWP